MYQETGIYQDTGLQDICKQFTIKIFQDTDTGLIPGYRVYQDTGVYQVTGYRTQDKFIINIFHDN